MVRNSLIFVLVKNTTISQLPGQALVTFLTSLSPKERERLCYLFIGNYPNDTVFQLCYAGDAHLEQNNPEKKTKIWLMAKTTYDNEGWAGT